LRRRWLWVCLLAVLLPSGLTAQQETEVAFDPTPVALPQTDAGSPRFVTSKDLLLLREIHGCTISPDGQWVAFIVGQANYERNGYRSGLFLIRTSGAEAPVSLGTAGMPHWTNFNEWESEPPQWSKDSRFVFYRTRMKREETWQVWQWKAKTRKGKQLTHVPGNIAKYAVDSSGQKIVMKVELATNPAANKRRFEQGILYSNQMTPWEGMPSILKKISAAERRSEVWVHELNTGIERLATGAEKRSLEPDVHELQETFDRASESGPEKCPIDKVSLAGDNENAALVCAYDEGEPSRIMRWKFILMSRDGKRRQELAPESIRVTDYWWSRDGTHLYFVSAQWDGRPGRIRVVDIDSGRVRDLFHSTDVLREFSMDAGDRWIACTRETNVTPPELVVIDSRTGTHRKLADLNPEFRHIRLGSVERVSGVNRFGEEWFGQLVKPLGYDEGKRYPLIVTLYRSGDYFLVGATGNENPIQVYAASGFLVLSFSIGRNRLRKNGDFDDYLLNWASPAASLEMAVRSLVERGIVDPKKVGLAGLSHGADILEYTISHSQAFQAAIESGPGARDPYFFYMAGGVWHELFAKWGLGGWPEGDSRKNWDTLGASLNADRIETPLLMNSADSEFLANLALYTSLEQLHKPVELYIHANELHVKNQPKHRYEIYERNVDWFRFWLEGEEDTSPEKRSQYSRWERLRENCAKR
jgi:dipeptidyl aminopeptidase/acylaminoacyl peptidase